MRTKIHTLLILILLVLISVASLSADVFARSPKGTIRVGIFPFEPFNFVDEHGLAQGLNPDLLREIIRDEDWQVEYVAGSWAEGLERLQSQQIDLMLSVAYTPQRAETMDFTYESVVELWGQVFVRPEGQSYNINDLSRRKVGVMRKDISGSNFITTAKNFAVTCEIKEYATHAEVFAAVQNKEVDAGVAPQHFGLRHANQYHLVGSSILFSPFSIYFASKKGTQHEILSHIDAHLSAWKKDKESVYYQCLNRWLGGLVPKPAIPTWLMHGLIGAIGIAILFAGFVLLLKRSVQLKTKELRLSEERFKDIVLSSNDWVWEMDAEAVFCYCSEHVIDLLGYEPAEVLGKKPLSFMLGDQRRKTEAFFDDLLNMPKPFRNFEDWYVRKDGQPICLLTAGMPIFAPGEKFLGYRGVATDITERKRADDALRDSETRHRTYLNSTPYAVFICDQQGKYLQVNPSACRITGYEEAELLTMGLTDLMFAEDRERGLAHFRNVVENGKSHGELPFRNKDGERRWWSVTAVKAADCRFLGFCNDITDLKLAEEERKRLQGQLTQAQKMEAIGTLAGGIAHDFNNILGAIIGYAEMARDDCPAGSTLTHDIEQILKAGNRAKDLVKQILAFSRQAKVDHIPLDPGQIVHEAITLLRASLPATITIKADIEADVGMILADPTQIHQIIINLCTNAFHAMEADGGLLQIALHSGCEEAKDGLGGAELSTGKWIELVISDTGVGISPDHLAKIFDPYFTTKEVGKGTGMGLAMVHGIVQSYGGKIRCHSEIGQGTVFTISLPTVQADSLPNGGLPEPIPTGSEHILLIDDEELLVEMGRAMLERLGYQVTGRCSSLEALAIFQADPTAFDLILTDQTMPAMTGFDLARRMRQIRADLPIILCTGYSSQISKEKATALGIKGFAMKPLAKREIATLIRSILDADKANDHSPTSH